MIEEKILSGQTFENFIVSSCNKNAYTACLELVENPRSCFVALYGNSSCGKSHLLNAVNKAFGKKYPEAKIHFVSYDEIISAYMKEFRKGTQEAFVENMLEFELLIMDNMQFVVGREATQMEIANLVNKMVSAGKPVIMAFDRPIECYDKLLQGIECDNAFRCNVVEIKKPDSVLKTTYLNRLLQEYKTDLPFIVKRYLVYSKTIPFSSFKGFLAKYLLLKKQKGTQLTIAEINKCLHDYKQKGGVHRS